ncbi:hypothetical protein DCS_01948 [Drechmeria coniospora]|uniref:RNase III domain-containing protein n=1 Tax=Drechmeria coniospora TaxID=98403 RepID=A0A151GUQ7_DRECN|nr:hypothetical protein DCS_01948 [Drechmeria coniospora]KYK60810.1 hypothetical protein DCS_01948 [Drechmeria coniospora]
MVLPPCRASLLRGQRVLTPLLRVFSTDSASTPSATAAEPFPSPSRSQLRSSSSSTGEEASSSTPPRWSQTPAGMKAPLQMDFAKSPRNKIWAVNNNPGRLDDMYNRLLGPGGAKMLPDELKWLAVTHKSFDQGRRGFNDRLALMGRLTLVMEATKDIVSRPPLAGTRIPDENGREPLEHAQLASVDNLNVLGPKDVVGKEKLYALATNVGMMDVMRWKPRLPERLEASGVEVVLNGAIFAIIGAITLQHGSVVASKMIRERILARLPRDE